MFIFGTQNIYSLDSSVHAYVYLWVDEQHPCCAYNVSFVDGPLLWHEVLCVFVCTVKQFVEPVL